MAIRTRVCVRVCVCVYVCVWEREREGERERERENVKTCRQMKSDLLHYISLPQKYESSFNAEY